MNKKKYVVTIARQFGSMGRPIAMKLSEILGIEFYDRDIVDQAAEKLNLPVSIVDENEETAKELKNNYSRMQFPLGRQKSTEVQDKIFEAQKNIINFMAEKESCIIVGRCGDFILSEMENTMHIYIYAPYNIRLQHCTDELGLSVDEGKRMIKKVDNKDENTALQGAEFALKKGDKVVTIGGMFGVITAISEKKVTLKLAEDVEVDFARSAISAFQDPVKQEMAEK